MRERWVEVLMLSAGADSSKPYPEEEVPAGSGHTYTVVCPDDEYCVAVNIYRNRAGDFPAPLMRVGLYVDGHDVNYWKRVDALCVTKEAAYVTAMFWGFKKSGNDLRQFKIARTMPSGVSNDNSEQISTVGGKIVAVIHSAEVVDGVYDNVGKSAAVPVEASVNENRKFFTLPSAVTVGGKSSQNKEEFNPVSRWKNTSDVPIATITLRYHTQAMLCTIKDIAKAATADPVIIDVADTDGGGANPKKRMRDADLSGDSVGNSGGDDGGDDGEIEIVPRAKVIPLLDLTADDECSTWITRTVTR
jgi:hypothetical protein